MKRKRKESCECFPLTNLQVLRFDVLPFLAQAITKKNRSFPKIKWPTPSPRQHIGMVRP